MTYKRVIPAPEFNSGAEKELNKISISRATP